jgi:hypothetical protein
MDRWDGAAAATWNRHLSALTSFTARAGRQEILAANPGRRLERRKPARRSDRAIGPPAPPASCPGCYAAAPQGRCFSPAGERPYPVREPLPRRTSARRPDAAGCPTRAPSTCSSRPPPPTTRTSRAGRSTSSATPPSSTWPPTDAPPPSSRPNPGTCTWAASAGTSSSASRPPPRSPPTQTPQHDAGLADQARITPHHRRSAVGSLDFPRLLPGPPGADRSAVAVPSRRLRVAPESGQRAGDLVINHLG